MTRSAVQLGVAFALGLLSKFSFLVFFPPAALALIAMRWPVRVRVRPALLAIGVAFVVFWAGYRFHIGRPADLYQHAGFFVEHSVSEPLRPLTRWLARTPLPAPEVVTGLAVLKLHDRDGHLSYLLGESRVKGWWYYFPVVFFYKTPIPFLLLMLWGIVTIVRARSRDGMALVLIALAIMGVAMTSSINIGIRHILPIYAPLAIVAAVGIAAIRNLARDAFSRATLFVLLLWLFGGVARAHPDYMAWFNEAAGADPSYIAADSNIDWGQDVLRLARVVRELKIERLPMHIVNVTRYEPLGIPAHELSPFHRSRGWVAISETQLRWAEATGDYAWLEPYRPVRRIGKSIRLYSIP
ncbi:MAG TPA: hypothetical protein VHL59_16505 [Thermoanaerobaculia bacterium]|nr:hypothetical protein [Thermoanaerobaculia bacterium]